MSIITAFNNPVQMYKTTRERWEQSAYTFAIQCTQTEVVRLSGTAVKREKITVITCVYQCRAREVMPVPRYLTAGGDEDLHTLPETVDYRTTHDDDLQRPGQCIHHCLFYTNSA